jgi:hypothetical protein
MSCPDEDTFARFVQGLLSAPNAAQVEGHLDGCRRCADLAAEFGRAYAEPGDETDAPARRPAALALAVGAVLQVAWGVVVAGATGAIERLVPPGLAAAYLHYAAVWAPLGGLVALVAAVGSLRGRPWGRALAVAYAAGSLASIVLTPLALLLLAARRRDRDVRPASDRA